MNAIVTLQSHNSCLHHFQIQFLLVSKENKRARETKQENGKDIGSSSSASPNNLKERERAITSAESSRSVGGLGPEYLTGVAYPWYSDRGQAPIHYDVHQVELLQSAIDKILDNNAIMCQLEYTANKKHGPSGQARS